MILSVIALPLVCLILGSAAETPNSGDLTPRAPATATSQEPYVPTWSTVTPNIAPLAPPVIATAPRHPTAAAPDLDSELELDREDDHHPAPRTQAPDTRDRTRDHDEDRGRKHHVWRWLT